ncbi:MAG: hypothetical protein KGH50_02060, partial [Candidatus Micrarchaeota archaeon]|nr:hypothetical protein [Candidatus Micrarchaeota archaeon]
MHGIVSCIRHGSETEYFITTAAGGSLKTSAAKSAITLQAGEAIETDEANGGEIGTALVEQDASFMSSVISLAEKTAARLSSSEPYISGIAEVDAATGRMWPRLSESASLFIRKLLLGTPTIVRFHNDSDGLSGAYSIYKAVEDLRSRGTGICPNMIWM